MPRHRRYVQAPEGRRSRRRSRDTSNWGGALAAVGAIAVLAVIAVVLAKKMDRLAEDTARENAEPTGSRDSGASTGRAVDASSQQVQKSAGRPAPELTGQMIIYADGMFRDARSFHKQALAALERGEKSEHDQLMAQCRRGLAKLEDYFEWNVEWLEEAQKKDWPVPTTYETMQRRLKKYAEFKAELPKQD